LISKSAQHSDVAAASWPLRLGALLRRIIGAPDYAAYVAHQRAHHPEREPLCERDFLNERLSARYEKPGARCC
jgi:uncharacterized short protein YbdD (DUF466 family)